MSAVALSRVMPNIGRTGKRRLLSSVVESQLLYAAPVWSEAASSTAKTRSIFRRPDILCGPVFEDLPMDHQKKATALNEAEETFRLFYKMVEDIITLKEIEERVRQAADNVANG